MSITIQIVWEFCSEKAMRLRFIANKQCKSVSNKTHTATNQFKQTKNRITYSYMFVNPKKPI